MAMQAAMTGSKQHAVLNDTLDRLESMAMAQAMAVAKFQKDVNGRMEMTEGMLMSQSHVAAKAQKSIDDRAQATCLDLPLLNHAVSPSVGVAADTLIHSGPYATEYAGITALEAMMMQAAMTAAKQNSQLANIMKLCTTLSEKQGDSDSDSDDDSDDDFTLDAATLAKVKTAAYEKLAKEKGKTVEELKAEAKEMSVRSPPQEL